MGIAAIQKSTGRLIEWQSNAKPGTCLANAIRAGLDPSDVEEQVFAVAPVPPVAPVPTLTIEALADALVAKNVLTRAEVDAKKK